MYLSGPVSYRDFWETGPWPLTGNETGSDFVLIQTLVLFKCKHKLSSTRTTWSTYEKQWGLYQNKVTPSLAYNPRAGRQADNCKMGYCKTWISRGVGEGVFKINNFVWDGYGSFQFLEQHNFTLSFFKVNYYNMYMYTSYKYEKEALLPFKQNVFS